MTKERSVALFGHKEVRRHYDEEQEQWYFAIVDVIAVLTDSADPKQYIKKMRTRDSELNSNWGTICTPIEMLAKDGKKRAVMCANTESLLRLIQSIPSPKAEPFKLWLAKVGYERIEENANPELSIDRAMQTYLAKGYSKAWINQRLKSIEVRKELTDEWEERGVKRGAEFAMLTNEMTKAWSDKSVKEYKQYKGLKKEGLRDHMTNLELVLNMLAEATTTEISQEKQPKGFEESKKIARVGGTIAGNTRREIEAKTGKRIVSPKNAKRLMGRKLDRLN